MSIIRLLLILFIVGLIAYSANAQEPDWKRYEYVGSSQQMAFMVNTKDAAVVKNRAMFKGIMADAITSNSTTGKEIYPDQTSYVMTEFEANCDTYEYTFLRATGIFRGQVVNIKYEPNNQVADKKTIIGIAIEKVCKAKLGLKA